jgi:hypothetical protein
VSQKEEQKNKEVVIDDISKLLNNSAVKEHTIRVDPNDSSLVMKVQVRELSFFDMQNAIKSFINLTSSGEVEIDLAGYWKYMYDKCIVSTEPSLSLTQLIGLNAYVGSQLTTVLPQPTELLAGPLEAGASE